METCRLTGSRWRTCSGGGGAHVNTSLQGHCTETADHSSERRVALGMC